MKPIAQLTLFLAWLCLCLAGLQAQQTGVEWITTKDGLSQGYINEILQDSEGFLWIATKNGLNRYDGYHFQVFTHDPYDKHSLSDDYLNSLFEYGDFLLVGTMTSGLNLFHKKTHQVYRVPNEVLLPGAPNDYVTILWAGVDADGNIWAQVDIPKLFTRMCKITLPTGFWQNPAAQEDWQKRLKVETWPKQMWGIVDFSNDRKMLYAAVYDTLFQVDVRSNQWTQIAQVPPVGRKNIEVDAWGNIWFTRIVDDVTSELYRLSPGASNTPTFIPVPPDFYRLQQITKDFIWIACNEQDEGFRLDKDGNFDPTRPEFSSIPVPRGHSCGITDRSGLVWVGTNGLGLIKVNFRSKHFHHLFPGQSIYGAVMQDRNGNICTFSNLVDLLFSSELSHNAVAPFLPGLKIMHSSTTTLEDAQGNFWIVGTHKDTRVFILKKIDPVSRLTLYNIPVKVFNIDCIVSAMDEKGHPWMAGDNSLIHFDPTTEKFDCFDFQKALPEAKGTTALTRSADGTWWIGMDKGLIRAKPTANGFDFTAFKNDPSTRNSLRHNAVSSLLADPNDASILWIGTKGGGLNRLDIRSLEFTHLTTREGLPNDVIYGILAEDDDPPSVGTSLWMSSNKGLIRYKPSSGLIKNYLKEDGIQDNEFNTWAYGKGADGTLMFGGINGLTVFHPRLLLQDSISPRTLLTGLRLNDREVSWNDGSEILTQSVEFTDAIKIPFAQNSVTLEFASMNFAAPTKNRFRYFLEGAEKQWAHESAERTATYLNLSPGTYTFRVKGSNSEGVWAEQPAVLKITVLPPWYRTWLAWLIYILIVGGSAYSFYRYQLRTKMEHAENERLKELDSVKTRLYTNITHEFRTPLTVILGMTEQIKTHFVSRSEEAFNNSLEMVRRNGKNLLQLINQILDLAKLESGKLSLNLVQGDVLAFARYVVESFHSYAEVKKVGLQFVSDIRELTMDYDKEKLQAILSNLLSNAIKFTPEGGRVQVAVTVGSNSGRAQLLTATANYLLLTVTDTGIGIPEEKRSRVFERFYQVDDSTTRSGEGTGIGLALVKELVKLMQGSIEVDSQPGEGSVFTVTLPITKNSGVQPEQSAISEVFVPAHFDEKATAAPLTEGSEKPLILVVEDNVDVRRYLIECLRGQYQVLEAHNGQRGIDLALEHVPDLVISDVMMPEKDGFQVCDALKNDDRTSHVPIVLLTARAAVEDRIAGLKRGADAYLTKPFHREELVVVLEKLIENRRILRARFSRGLTGEEVPVVEAEIPEEIVVVENAFLKNLRGIVEEHLSEAEFDMNQLSRAVGMSHTQIFRKLKALTGRSPSTFIRSVRLHHAREKLKTTTLTVSEIAYESGFTSPAYFSTMFLEEFGKTPTESR